MSDERRKKPRIPWIKFDSKVKVRRGLFNTEWVDTVPFDYSKYGMGMQTDEEFVLGDVVFISIALEMEVGIVALEQVPGIIRYREKHHSRFNYGVEFDYGSRYLSRESVKADLEHIEQILTKHEQMKERMDGL